MSDKQQQEEENSQKDEQQSQNSKPDEKDSSKKSGEEKPAINALEASGVALFKSVDDSKINHPEKGELKRSLRLFRLLSITGLAIAGLMIIFGLLAYPMAGLLKLLALIIAIAFTARCTYVAIKLWKNLQ